MYNNAIVTFIDILGFRDLVQSSAAEKISNVLDAVRDATSPLRIDDVEVVSFSDSIVRVQKIEASSKKEDVIELLFHEFISMVHAQGQLIDFDVIIRGGISIGDIFISGGRVFGPGLIKAYELESKFALYPRIVVDPRLIESFLLEKHYKKIFHRVKHDLEIVGGLLRQGDDGLWYIDYASVMETEVDEHEMYLNFLYRQKEVIIAGTNKHLKLDSVLRKFIWLAHYHNQIVKNIDEEYFDKYKFKKEELLITSDDIPSLQYLIR